MPALSTLLLFAAAAISVNLTPGPDMLYVVARSLGGGRWAGFVSALGLSVGYIVYTVLAALGLAQLLLAYPAAFNVVKIAGAAYLVYLGARTIRARQPVLPPPDTATATTTPNPSVGPQLPLRRVFVQGALTSTLNPSIAVFFLAFLPQFVVPDRGAVFAQIVVLGLVFNTTATLTHTTIALLTGTAGDWLGRRQDGTARLQRWITGGLLIVLGARVLLTGGGSG